MTPKRMSLADYAKEHPRRRVGVVPWMETIPEQDRAEAVAAYEAGVGCTTIREWLADECGHGDEATRNRVEGWLRTHAKTPAH